MHDPTALDLLIASNAAQWVVLFWHLYRCRDVRYDVWQLKQRK